MKTRSRWGLFWSTLPLLLVAAGIAWFVAVFFALDNPIQGWLDRPALTSTAPRVSVLPDPPSPIPGHSG